MSTVSTFNTRAVSGSFFAFQTFIIGDVIWNHAVVLDLFLPTVRFVVDQG